MSMYQRFILNGLNIDVDPVDLAPEQYNNTNNMVPRVGSMARAGGYEEVYPTPLFPPYWMLSSPQLGVPWWVYAGLDNIAQVSGTGVHVDITPAGMQTTTENAWTGGNLNGIAIMNTPQNPGYYWFNGQGSATELPGLRTGTTYGVMRPFKYHLIGMDVSEPGGEFVDEVHWSNAADPGQVPDTWVPAADNEAGDNILADESGRIIDGLALRDSFYIYKQDSVYEMTFSGGAEVFRFRKVFGTVGVLTKNCIVRVKGSHVVLGNGDIYRHDGQNMESIAEGSVKRAFFSTIDNANFNNSFVVYLEPAEEVWFCVPTTGNSVPDLALVWNTVTGTFGYRGIGNADFIASGVIPETTTGVDWDSELNTWDGVTRPWLTETFQNTEDALMIADATKQKFFIGNKGVTADGDGYVSSVERLGLSLDDSQHEKRIKRIWPRINAPVDAVFTLTVYNQRDPQADQEKVYETTFTQTTKGVPVNCNARYFGFTIATNDSVTWDVAGIDVEYLPRGAF